MESPKLVAFTGRAGSGKSTAAKALVEQGYVLVKFADTLKDMLRALYTSAGLGIEIIDRMIEGDLKDEPCLLLGGKTPRYAMQTMGTEWGRVGFDENLWVRVWNQKAIRLLANGNSVVVDDCRFPNEAEAVKRLGGEIWEIEADKPLNPNGHSHPSELGLGRRFIDGYFINHMGGTDRIKQIVRERFFGSKALPGSLLPVPEVREVIRDCNTCVFHTPPYITRGFLSVNGFGTCESCLDSPELPNWKPDPALNLP